MKKIDRDTPRIAVFGASSCPENIYQRAREVGREIVKRNAILICGGLGGVMEASALGAYEEGGLTIGILPTGSDKDANPYIMLPILTDMGHARNVILARSCHAGIAITGGFGTLSEIALTLKLGKPMVSLDSWDLDSRVFKVSSPKEAVEKIFQLLGIKS